MDPSLLNTIRTRPRFVYESNLSKEQYLELLRDYFHKKNKKIGGYISEDLSYFRMRQTKDSIWSPCLQLKVEEDPLEKKTYVRGLFGPKPSIWTLFSFLYFGSMVFGFMSLMFYISSLSFSTQPLLLIAAIFFFIIMVSLFLISKIGQYQTRHQMRLLKTFILMVIKKDLVEENS